MPSPKKFIAASLLPSPSCLLESDLQQLLVSLTVDRVQLRRLLAQKSSQRGFLRRRVGQAGFSWFSQTIGILCTVEKLFGIKYSTFLG